MADIARLGFAADTGDLKNAKAALEQLVPAATKAERATTKFNAAAAGITAGTKGANAGIKSFQAAAMGAATSGDRLSKAALASGTAMGTVQRAASGITPTLNLITAGAERQITRLDILSARWSAFLERLRAARPAAEGATSSLDRLGAAANDNINRLQSTPGNIAAQFQDIGVTAAAGMNPMLIALQQGTQLSSAMAGGLGNLLRGFAQILSPVTLLTVGLVGLVAAGLQMVDWIEVARWGLNALAGVIETVSVAAAYLGVVMAIAFAPQIIAWITTTTVAIGRGLVAAITRATMAMVAFSLANPFAAIVIAIGAVIGAMILLNNTFGGVFTDILAGIKRAANFMISAFLGAFDVVAARARGLAQIISGIVTMDGGKISAGWEQMANAPSFAEGFANRQGVDYVGAGVDAVRGAASAAADWLRGKAAGLGAETGDDKKSKTGKTEAEKALERYNDLIEKTEARVKALQVEATALGMTEHAARLYRNEQDLLAQALETGVPITDAVTRKMKELAKALTDAEIDVEVAKATKAFQDQQQALRDQAQLIGLTGLELEYTKIRQELVNEAVKAGIIDLNNMNDTMREHVALLGERAMILAQASQTNETAEFMADALEDHEEAMWMLERERDEIGLTGVALEAYRIQTDMLADARRRNIDLTPEEIAALQRYADEQAVVTDMIRRQREQIEEMRETARGFFRDWFDGIMEGKNIFASFADAVIGGLQRIASKMMDRAIDKFLDMMFAGNTGGNGGLLNSIFAAVFRPNALGGAYGPSGHISQYAKGGTFTNSIVDTPTFFRFAKGAALGEMGEAGPEAIMPLKRGPDGSLGVQATGAGRSVVIHAPVTVNNDNRVTGAVSSEDIIAMQRAQAEQTKREIERSIPDIINSYQIDGARV